MKRMNTEAGENLNTVCGQAIRMAKVHNRVQFNFSGVEVEVAADSDYKKVAAAIMNTLNGKGEWVIGPYPEPK